MRRLYLVWLIKVRREILFDGADQFSNGYDLSGMGLNGGGFILFRILLYSMKLFVFICYWWLLCQSPLVVRPCFLNHI